MVAFGNIVVLALEVEFVVFLVLFWMRKDNYFKDTLFWIMVLMQVIFFGCFDVTFFLGANSFTALITLCGAAAFCASVFIHAGKAFEMNVRKIPLPIWWLFAVVIAGAAAVLVWMFNSKSLFVRIQQITQIVYFALSAAMLAWAWWNCRSSGDKMVKLMKLYMVVLAGVSGVLAYNTWDPFLKADILSIF